MLGHNLPTLMASHSTFPEMDIETHDISDLRFPTPLGTTADHPERVTEANTEIITIPFILQVRKPRSRQKK